MRRLSEHIRTIHLVCDNVSTHHGKEVRKWLAKHPRFVVHFTPVHCSWMNQVEQWFSILQRKRLRIVDFDIQRSAPCEARPVHSGMESACASVQLVHEICGQGHGRGTCPGGLIIGYLIMTSCTKESRIREVETPLEILQCMHWESA